MASDGDHSQALSGVTRVKDNDIICGRGGLAPKHPGNAAYRKIVGLNKELYATCLKTEKLRISKSIVAAIREIKGRFLEREDGKTSSSLDEKDDDGNPVKWRDIGDKKAIEKTSQALREGQPRLLKKLAQQQYDGAMHQVVGIESMAINANFNHAGFVPQPHMMPQFGQMQSIQQSVPDNFNQAIQGSMQMHGHQLPVQNTFQAQQRLSLTTQQRPSFTLASFVKGQTDSFIDNNLNRMISVSQGRESWQDSWGSEDPGPIVFGRTYERSNSRTSQDSWGVYDPTPLPYVEGGGQNHMGGHDFSTDDHRQLMTCLGVDGDASQGMIARNNIGNKRPSVKFHLEPQLPSTPAMSLNSHLSELSIFSSDALSLDSAMDAAQREADLEMLGEFDQGEMSIGTFESPALSGLSPEGSGNTLKPRRSILRKSNKWITQAATFLSAPLNHNVDPGMIFTSTLDTKPGGVNSGTDVSGLMGEHRKNAVACEISVNRRRSSRMSLCSALTEFSGAFKRDVGSVLSIQSADFRELMADIASDEDDDSLKRDAL